MSIHERLTGEDRERSINLRSRLPARLDAVIEAKRARQRRNAERERDARARTQRLADIQAAGLEPLHSESGIGFRADVLYPWYLPHRLSPAQRAASRPRRPDYLP